MTRVKQPQGQKHAQSQRGDKAGTGMDMAERCTHCHGQDAGGRAPCACCLLLWVQAGLYSFSLHTEVMQRDPKPRVFLHQLQLISPRRECVWGKQKVSTKTATLLIPLKVTPQATSCRVNLHHLATRKHSRGKCWADSSQHGIVHQGHRRESVIFLSRSVGIWLRHQ